MATGNKGREGGRQKAPPHGSPNPHPAETQRLLFARPPFRSHRNSAPHQAELAGLVVGKEAEDALDGHNGQPHQRVALRELLQGRCFPAGLWQRRWGEPRRIHGASFPFRQEPLSRYNCRHLGAYSLPRLREGALPVATLPPPSSATQLKRHEAPALSCSFGAELFAQPFEFRSLRFRLLA